MGVPTQVQDPEPQWAAPVDAGEAAVQPPHLAAGMCGSGRDASLSETVLRTPDAFSDQILLAMSTVCAIRKRSFEPFVRSGSHGGCPAEPPGLIPRHVTAGSEPQW